MKPFSFLLLLLVFTGCAKLSTETKTIDLQLSGDMLFSGANTLQMPVQTTTQSLAGTLNLEESQLKNIGLNKATIRLTEEQKAITESLLLQIVSANNEMLSLGTLNPLPEGTEFELNLAEEVDLLPYLNDEDATWVLDLNLSEDYMDEMKVSGQLELNVNYKD